MVHRVLLALALTFCLSAAAIAADAPSAAADPELEKRVMQIAEELRCLVCQNQTIADSHAELAVDLKNQVREMIRKGKSDREIKDYMVQRYGDFVLYRPPVKTSTWLLWVGPFVLLVGGIVVLILKLRARGKKLKEDDNPLSADQQSRVRNLLAEKASPGNKKS